MAAFGNRLSASTASFTRFATSHPSPRPCNLIADEPSRICPAIVLAASGRAAHHLFHRLHGPAGLWGDHPADADLRAAVRCLAAASDADVRDLLGVPVHRLADFGGGQRSLWPPAGADSFADRQRT